MNEPETSQSLFLVLRAVHCHSWLCCKIICKDIVSSCKKEQIDVTSYGKAIVFVLTDYPNGEIQQPTEAKWTKNVRNRILARYISCPLSLQKFRRIYWTTFMWLHTACRYNPDNFVPTSKIYHANYRVSDPWTSRLLVTAMNLAILVINLVLAYMELKY